VADNESTLIYAAAYGTLDDAKLDFEVLKELHKEKWIGHYESALFTKEEDGSVKIIDTDATVRARAGKIGALVGATVGLIFPMSLVVGTLVGGGIGLAGGQLAKGLKRGDIKDLGELLDEGEAGIVFVGMLTAEEGLDRYLKRSAKTLKKQIDADAEALKKAVDEAAKG
jgi:uncharacterized membrane protein